MSSPGYVYDQGWEQERARLAGIEALWDPGTQDLLLRAGVAAGSRVLEAGAGGGSIVAWLAGHVGSDGHVLAVDIDTRFVEPLQSTTVEVRRTDLVTDELPTGEFDVVHCRMVLEHLADRDRVLDRLIEALRPGGALVIEDYDWTGFGFESAVASEQRATEAILAFMTAAGYDRVYGRTLVTALANRGLMHVYGAGRSLVIDDTHPGYAFFRLSFEQLAPLAVDGGLMTPDDAESTGESLRSGGRRIITPTLIAATGRMPSH